MIGNLTKDFETSSGWQYNNQTFSYINIIMFKNTKGFCLKAVLIVVALIVVVIAVVIYAVRHIGIDDVLNNSFVQEQIIKQADKDKDSLFSFLPHALGISQPRTYLLLFLNNTELRPGGGFIGSYATVRMEHGKMELLALEGTEKIDARTPDDWRPSPPYILKDHLNVDRWYFRDANWWPDFALSAQKALVLYKGEGGIVADDIDAVVGVTTHVLEDILKITGPVTVDGVTFDADNAIATLEYEVEYGYDDKGIHFSERKDIMKPFMLALLDKMKDTIIGNFSEYEPVFKKLISEKHIMMYSDDEAFSALIRHMNMDATMKQTQGDYMLWSDANLAALKTDHVMKRTLHYTLTPHTATSDDDEDYFIARVAMNYQHFGVFDWRTTRYRTYARVFVPEGSELIKTNGSMRWDRTTDEGVVDSGIEYGKTWFATFIAIEPGKTGELSFVYKLPASLTSAINTGNYHLDIQKQPGAGVYDVLLDLDFNKNISSAHPAEESGKWGDDVYQFMMDLRVDREFEVSL